MKAFVIFSLCITSVFAVIVTKEQFNKFSSECASEMGFDPAEIDKNKTKSPTKNEESCYLACIDKKQGVMKQDGTYDINVILNYVETSEMKTKVQSYIDELIKTCKPEVGNDTCKLAACFHRMPKAYWEKE
ncbi:PREDICTED: uncharacterized protein LOC105367989 [Ceratosolen solmsi marchali]|uniref:Uncharacterized protein LOC105367989 n=1 Tax=Ceratosolen solmsi marchali TaxID=326594 RepID=A0AAJ6YVN0_9HYME|nr:PREDICTED: uncharacterized protein LOC105367989 [Ceratosolen solmsi marchali]